MTSDTLLRYALHQAKVEAGQILPNGKPGLGHGTGHPVNLALLDLGFTQGEQIALVGQIGPGRILGDRLVILELCRHFWPDSVYLALNENTWECTIPFTPVKATPYGCSAVLRSLDRGSLA